MKAETENRPTSVDEALASAEEKITAARELEDRLKAGEMGISADSLARVRADAEHAVLVAEGAKAAEEKARVEERRRGAEKLHRRFSADMAEAVQVINERLDEAQEAAVKALAALDAYEAIRNEVRQEHSRLFAGTDDPDDPARLAFLDGTRPGGTFGRTAFGQTSRVDPVGVMMAAIVDRLRGRDRAKESAVDRDWLSRLTDPTRGNEYRALRTLKERIENE